MEESRRISKFKELWLEPLCSLLGLIITFVFSYYVTHFDIKEKQAIGPEPKTAPVLTNQKDDEKSQRIIVEN